MHFEGGNLDPSFSLPPRSNAMVACMVYLNTDRDNILRMNNRRTALRSSESFFCLPVAVAVCSASAPKRDLRFWGFIPTSVMEHDY